MSAVVRYTQTAHNRLQMKTARQQILFATTADRVRIAYATAGEGMPLVKAANWFSHVQFDWQSSVWQHWHSELARYHSYYRYDRRGCGLSDWDVEQSFEGFYADIEAVIQALGLERFVLLGMAHGGAVAAAYAARHPEKVSHLVLYGAHARGRRKRNPTPRQLDEIEMNLKLAEIGWGADDPSFQQFFTTQFMPDATTEQMRAFTELQRVSTLPQFAVRHLRAVFDIDVTGLAPKIRCPTLVLHAQGDLRVPFEEGRLFASMIPGARFVPIGGRNHFLLEQDAAWTQFVAELRAFLPAAAHSPQALFTDLTARESQVLELVSQGLDNAQIAAWLELSEKTVRNHITAIFSKLEVVTRAQAIVRAREAGYPQHLLKSSR
jgi:pimeloyl-ACP methyl ester carboxylesterase/DNA-binding CsgD family transcriptional regulator